jgi:hypothetical protein
LVAPFVAATQSIPFRRNAGDARSGAPLPQRLTQDQISCACADHYRVIRSEISETKESYLLRALFREIKKDFTRSTPQD